MTDKMDRLHTLAGSTNCLHANLFCRSVTAQVDERQRNPTAPYTVPDEDQRRLMAELVLEEALETIEALGFSTKTVSMDRRPVVYLGESFAPRQVDLEKVIDGACDTIFVATGVLAGCGVPDTPHLEEVNRANQAKFPYRRVVLNPSSGKYLRPEGWEPPDHNKVREIITHRFNQLPDEEPANG